MKYLSIVLFCLLIATCLLCCSCKREKVYFGSTGGGFEDFPPNPISVQDAIKLADPYLDKTFELRIASREHVSDKEASLWITLKGDYYYLVKDNYPSYTPGFYLNYAVKINKDTGEVIPPK